MYDLPKETDLSFLHGATLIQVAVGLYQIQFIFQERINISVESDIRCTDAAGCVTEWTQGNPRLIAPTLDCLHCKVTSVVPHESGRLELGFSNGVALVIAEKVEFEAYSITAPGRETIIV